MLTCKTSAHFTFFHIKPADDFNRVLLKLDEGRSQDSDPDEDDEEEDSSDEEDEDSQYINASHITVTFGLFMNPFLCKLLKIPADVKLLPVTFFPVAADNEMCLVFCVWTRCVCLPHRDTGAAEPS